MAGKNELPCASFSLLLPLSSDEFIVMGPFIESGLVIYIETILTSDVKSLYRIMVEPIRLRMLLLWVSLSPSINPKLVYSSNPYATGYIHFIHLGFVFGEHLGLDIPYLTPRLHIRQPYILFPCTITFLLFFLSVSILVSCFWGAELQSGKGYFRGLVFSFWSVSFMQEQ